MSAAPVPVIGRWLFTDGITRPVHRGPDGREYVIGPARGRVYGTWLVPDTEPDTAIMVMHPDHRG